jgi:hypothetical protein
MPTTTYEYISSGNLTSGSVNSVTFGSGGTLTQAYTDLVLVVNGGASNPADITATYNGDTGTNYTFQSMAKISGNGISGSRYNAGNYMQFTSNSYFRTGFKNLSHNTITSYSNPYVNKTSLSRSTYDGTEIDLILSSWKNINAITSITLTLSNSATWTSSSTMYLYGIKEA